MTPDVRALVDAALELHRDHPEITARLSEHRARLEEPVRIALVGRVKAGKSTLLNALVGARVAPTDAGECTRLVTVYRHGRVPRVAARTGRGERDLPVRRVDGGLLLDLAGVDADDVDHLRVDWPTAGLAAATLVDTPGIASLSADLSARTRAFLEPPDGLPGADAVLFLTRQLQAGDVDVLRDFQARAGSRTTTITVLSRADEIGAGGLDALLQAGQVAERMAADPAVTEVSPTVLPVAGLLGLAGRTLRHGDFVALRSLARTAPAELQPFLLTADRFCRPEIPGEVAPGLRRTLVERFGLFGVRLSVALVRAGIDGAQELADELVRRSGLEELHRRIAVEFTARGAHLQEASALAAVEWALRSTPADGDERLRYEAERLRLTVRDVVGPAALRSDGALGDVPAGVRAEAARLLGAGGGSVAARLGLPEDTPPEALHTAALAALDRWQAHGDDPLAARAVRDAAGAVVRSVEAVLAELDEASSAGAGPQPAAG
ncbi:50S ribosome-binding GTPase [Blastococcus aggregatus]|uniref:50S ribosome-binding GTPase n=1 Tax=Blastococcus aggregatus TaxID=38502 RepID=A0A285VH71_9ACTN|nr:dynamin family protein [Blastococcus aggregatus]SOC53343.1 50S ribosome-binding GTPase [Blastococcus aggregatus]